MLGLRADANRIAIAAQRFGTTDALRADLEVGRDLLSPISRDAAADREDSEAFMITNAVREIFEVEEWIERERWLMQGFETSIMDREVEAEF